MKLFSKYNRITLVTTSILFILSAFAYYSAISWVLTHELDESLDQYQSKVSKFVLANHKLPPIDNVDDLDVEYKPVANPIDRKYELITLYDAFEKKNEQFRRLLYSENVNGQYYQVSIAKPLEGVKLMAKLIAGTTLILLLITFAISLLLNQIILKRLWNPFLRMLDSVKKFKLGGSEPTYPETDINEFVVMRNALRQMITNAEQDYRTLKEFTENASHELQTPLAIIRSKLDIVIQGEGLTEGQVLALQSAYDNIKRLTTLNQSLLLLAKLDNRQYSTHDEVDIAAKVGEKLNDFKEFWEDKRFRLAATLEPSSITANAEMIDVLLINLLSNAGRHTLAGGAIAVLTGVGTLQIRNTAQGKALDKSRLFNRFYKAEATNIYNGLGLSIVKRICDQAGISITYDFESNEHVFSLGW